MEEKEKEKFATIEKEKTGKGFCWRLNLIFLILLIILGGAFFLWFKKTESLRKESKEKIEISKKVKEEIKRCSNYLSQEGGEFGEYEYCKRYLNIFSQ